MHLLDALLDLVAPHDCLGCGCEGRLLCSPCSRTINTRTQLPCLFCKKASCTVICSQCTATQKLTAMHARADYADLAKKLVHAVKFERKHAGLEYIAELMVQALPEGVYYDIITYIPTVHSRRRERGYDQAEQIALHMAKRLGSTKKSLIVRRGDLRQVGSSRKARLEQLKDVFMVYERPARQDLSILLVDDVVTTGGSILFACQALHQAGYRNISVAVFAQTV